jgi:hypothetical protein
MTWKSERRDVAAIHEELARQYQALIDQAQLQPPTGMNVPDRLSA